MSVSQLLMFSRVFGAKNVSQAKNFAKAIKTGATGVSKMHLELTPEMCDEFVRVAEQGVAKPYAPLRQFLDSAKKFFPKTYAKGSKVAVDVEVNRLGAESGTIKFNQVVKTAEGKVVAEGKGVIAKNAGGAKCNVSGVAEGFDANCDATILRNAEPNIAEVLPKLKYKAENGVAELSIPRAKGKGYDVQANFKYPEEMLNQQVKMQTCGEFNNFEELLDKARIAL